VRAEVNTGKRCWATKRESRGVCGDSVDTRTQRRAQTGMFLYHCCTEYALMSIDRSLCGCRARYDASEAQRLWYGLCKAETTGIVKYCLLEGNVYCCGRRIALRTSCQIAKCRGVSETLKSSATALRGDCGVVNSDGPYGSELGDSRATHQSRMAMQMDPRTRFGAALNGRVVVCAAIAERSTV
jgi:hypothetical protein